jgi:putative transposase
MRLRDWDYGEDGAYFVTICAHDRECILSDPLIVRALRTEWARAVCGGRQFDPYEFVVMPNHVHGIVWTNRSGEARARHFRDHAFTESVATTDQAKSHQSKGASALRTAGCAPGSLGAKVGAFKSAACKRVRALRGTPSEPVWQGGYHDRVIRDERGLERARQYIIDNPAKWAEDKYNPANAPGSDLMA